jgi:hypothetical protein
MSGFVTTPINSPYTAVIKGNKIIHFIENTYFNTVSFNSPGDVKAFKDPEYKRKKLRVADNIDPHAGENAKKRRELDKREKKNTHEHLKTPTDDQRIAGIYARDVLDGGNTPPEENNENFAPLIHQNASAKDVANALMDM